MERTPTLTNRTRAARFIAHVGESRSQKILQALVEAFEQFFREQPAHLKSDFDLAFIVEAASGVLPEIVGVMDGSVYPFGWNDEDQMWRTVPVDVEDVSDSGIRGIQAFNYMASCMDPRVKGVMLRLMSVVESRQMSLTRSDGRHYAVIFPESSVDYLFLVTAAEHALREGQPLRSALASEPLLGS